MDVKPVSSSGHGDEHHSNVGAFEKLYQNDKVIISIDKLFHLKEGEHKSQTEELKKISNSYKELDAKTKDLRAQIEKQEKEIKDIKE